VARTLGERKKRHAERDDYKESLMNCGKCHRRNPAVARFCWFDGEPLHGSAGAVDVAHAPFIRPCQFPSGRLCRNFEELALACQDEWSVAAGLLRNGLLETFLVTIGRTDLATLAGEAARFPDVNQGLDHFLAKIPSQVVPEPRLRAEPASVDAGVLAVGQDHLFSLRLINDGKRRLYGWINTDSEWLLIGDTHVAAPRRFQFAVEESVPVRIEGKLLRAAANPLEGNLVAESNGGTVKIPITVMVPIKPFPEGVLEGAVTPRELAKKARDAAKDAAVLFENGAVAHWYQDNGWIYPVPRPYASDLAAVQQFLEALGLVKTPPVELSEDFIRLRGAPGEKIEYSLAVITQESRAAIAHGSSDQEWLEVGPTIFRGRSAFLPLTIPAVTGAPGETFQAVVSVTANGGQRFTVPVELTVGATQTAETSPAPQPPLALPPLLTAELSAEPIEPASSPLPLLPVESGKATLRQGWIFAVAIIFLVAGFLGTVIHDLLLQPEEESSPTVAPPLGMRSPRR
jgi:hypothetical protein